MSQRVNDWRLRYRFREMPSGVEIVRTTADASFDYSFARRYAMKSAMTFNDQEIPVFGIRGFFAPQKSGRLGFWSIFDIRKNRGCFRGDPARSRDGITHR